MSATNPTRRHDLDWLRVIACYLLFLFHVGMVFNPAPFFHVRNAEGALPFLVLFQVGFLYMGLLSIIQQFADESVVLNPVTD